TSDRGKTMQTYQHFIDGAPLAPASNDYFDTVNPYTGEAWARIAKGNVADIDRAVAAARAAFDGWSAMKPSARGKLLMRLADLIERDAARPAEIEGRDNGKLLAEVGGQTK